MQAPLRHGILFKEDGWRSAGSVLLAHSGNLSGRQSCAWIVLSVVATEPDLAPACLGHSPSAYPSTDDGDYSRRECRKCDWLGLRQYAVVRQV